MLKAGTRVKTQYGEGVVKVQEINGSHEKVNRLGILHDTFPPSVPRMYKDDVMYFFSHEVEVDREGK